MEYARRWLAEQGVTQVGDNHWTSAEAPEDGPLTNNEVAHGWAYEALEDPDLDTADRSRLGIGLLDLLDDYWVTVVIGFAMARETDPLPDQPVWAAYRRRLEAPEPADPVTYSLWVDWFEVHDRVEHAFAEVLGNDVDDLRAGGRLHELSHEPLLRRTRWVLRNSGPVPWPVKFPVYQAALTQPDLHLALFRGLLNGYHDLYGRLELRPALTLLAKLDLPADTEHLVRLTTVLHAGHTNHYRSPDAWKAAAADV